MDKELNRVGLEVVRTANFVEVLSQLFRRSLKVKRFEGRLGFVRLAVGLLGHVDLTLGTRRGHGNIFL